MGGQGRAVGVSGLPGPISPHPHLQPPVLAPPTLASSGDGPRQPWHQCGGRRPSLWCCPKTPTVLWDPGPSARGGAPTAGVWPGTLPSLGPCGPGAHRPAPARWVAGPALAPFRELTWPTPPLPRGFRTALGLVQSQRPGCQVSSFRAEGAKHRTGAASRGGLGLGGAPAPVPPSHSRVPCVCTTLRTSFPSLTSPAPTPGACTHPLTAAQSCRPHSVLCSGPG